jgi:hypothetical protein
VPRNPEFVAISQEFDGARSRHYSPFPTRPVAADAGPEPGLNVLEDGDAGRTRTNTCRTRERLGAMYNLITGAVDGVLSAERLLEGIDPELNAFLRPGGNVDISRLLSLPTLLMPERGDTSRAQVAQVGNVISLTTSGRNVHFRFVRSGTLPDIPSERIESIAAELRIGTFGFNRTRWTVNSPDLYQVLFETNLLGFPRPTAFVLSIAPPKPDRIAVMMPFQAEFDSVWATLKAVGEAGGWVCQRADDIWEDKRKGPLPGPISFR